MGTKTNTKNAIANSLVNLASVICGEKRYKPDEANKMGFYSALQISQNNKCGLHHTSVKRKLNELEKSGLVESVMSFHKNSACKFYKLKKSS